MLAAYLSQLFRRNGSHNTLSMAYAALVWLHDTVNVTASYNPLKTGVCKNVVEAAQRSATQRKNRNLPVSTDMVKTIVAKYGKVDANLKDLPVSVIVLLGFAGFFRFKELANIRTSYIKFAHDICLFLYLIVRQMSTGKAIRLLSLERAMSCTCPVNMVWHMSVEKMDTNSSGLLIRQLIFRKNSNGYVLGNKGISYSRCREIFLDALAALGYDP